MALSYKFPFIYGTSAERITGPTGGWTNYPAGWIFVETDTLLNYYWNGTAWVLLSTVDDADFVVYVDPNDSNKIKARGVGSTAVEFSHATDLGNVLNSIHGSLSSTSGGTTKIKSGNYGWATKLSVTKSHVGLKFDKGAIIAPTNAADVISVEKDQFLLDGGYWDLTSVGNGNGSWIVAGVTTNSDFMKIYNAYVKNPGTNGISLQANCGGSLIIGNQIQSFLAPTGDGILIQNCADHEIMANGIGGFGNATNGYGLRASSAINMIIKANRIFVNRINVRLYLVKGTVFSGNLIQAANQHGVHIVNDTASDVGRCIITSNRIHDNSASSTGTYSGIAIAITSTGVIDNLIIQDNVISDQAAGGSKKQKYGIEITNGPNLLTNSIIAFNALAGNQTGALNLGAYDTSNRVLANTGDIASVLINDTVASVAKTANYTATISDSTIRCDASGGAFTITLPSAVTVGAGKRYMIKRTDFLASSNLLTIATTSSQTIDGATNEYLRSGTHLKVESDGANWIVIDRSPLQPMRKGTTANLAICGGTIGVLQYATATSTTLPAINTLYAVPILIENTTKFDVITFRIGTVSTAGVARMGIYRDDGNMYPGTLLFDTGSLDTTVTGGAAPRSVSVTISNTAPSNQVFSPGVYWLTWECGVDAPQIKVISAIANTFSFGFDRNVSNGNPYFCYTVAHTFGALPDPFTAGGAQMTTTPTATNPVPQISLRPL